MNSFVEVKVSFSLNSLLFVLIQISKSAWAARSFIKKKKILWCVFHVFDQSSEEFNEITSNVNQLLWSIRLTASVNKHSLFSLLLLGGPEDKMRVSHSFCLFVFFPLCSLIHSSVLPIIWMYWRCWDKEKKSVREREGGGEKRMSEKEKGNSVWINYILKKFPFAFLSAQKLNKCQLPLSSYF